MEVWIKFERAFKILLKINYLFYWLANLRCGWLCSLGRLGLFYSCLKVSLMQMHSFTIGQVRTLIKHKKICWCLLPTALFKVILLYSGFRLFLENTIHPKLHSREKFYSEVSTLKECKVQYQPTCLPSGMVSYRKFSQAKAGNNSQFQFNNSFVSATSLTFFILL